MDNGLAQYHMYQVLSTGNHVRSLVTLTHTLNTYMGEVKVDLTNNLPGPDPVTLALSCVSNL